MTVFIVLFVVGLVAFASFSIAHVTDWLIYRWVRTRNAQSYLMQTKGHL